MQTGRFCNAADVAVVVAGETEGSDEGGKAVSGSVEEVSIGNKQARREAKKFTEQQSNFYKYNPTARAYRTPGPACLLGAEH